MGVFVVFQLFPASLTQAQRIYIYFLFSQVTAGCFHPHIPNIVVIVQYFLYQ